jgi:hypothetical protein
MTAEEEGAMKASMMLAILVMTPIAWTGCAHRDRVRAEYHHNRAERELKRGNFVKAAHEEQRARDAEEDARRAPLP